MKKHLVWDLFWTFLKIGLFTFGGGYAMISIIENICVEKKQWITHDEMMDMTVIAESTPGPIAINCATFVGYRQAGFPGSLTATLGIVFPAFSVIFILSRWLDGFLKIEWVANAFQGMKVAVGVLIVNAAVSMVQKMPRKALSRAIMAGSFAVMLFVNLYSVRFSSVGLMLAAAGVGLAALAAENRTKRGGAEK